ncbi:MAG: response regulator [Bacteroidales bacterium]|nr:response regulator [Bacteroidales bacterium]
MKVLIVEDDNASRFFLESLLESNGYTFRSAANGIEGLNIFDEYKPDLVLTDIQMPIMDGLELLEAIRDKKSDAIVIIITAFGTENYAIQALHLGANNYLKKPVSSQALLRLLKKYKAIITSKYSPDALPGYLINRNFQIEFRSEFNKIPKIVDKVIVESSLEIDDNIKVNIELGLVELITNAIEHGNLAIDYHEKQKALDEGTLDELYEDRVNNPKFRNRKIFVDFFTDNKIVRWTITDEGEGFDWNLLPNPTDQDHILELSGRGIFITRFLFDKVEFSGKGNVVTATKFLTENDSSD